MSAKALMSTSRLIGVLLILAICAGLGVANVYYLQPGLSLVQSEFGTSPNRVGWMPTLTQIGYALGMLLLAPLGDVVSRRRLILCKAALLILALLASSTAPNLGVLAAASIIIGLLGSIGQDFVPIAAQLAPESRRGHAVGIVTTGLLCGILLSRTLGGLVADNAGWRAMQVVAAGLMVLVMVVAWHALPVLPPTTSVRYGSLLGSLWTLWRHHRALRLAMLTQALLAATLGAFWSTLALVVAAPPFLQGAGVAGTFGLAGVAGALAAPLFGRFADRSGPHPAIRAGCLLVIVAFLGMWLLPGELWSLAIGAVVFDLGVMAALVSHQSIVNSLDPQARSRLNGLLMTGAMCGMATGAAAGSLVWTHAGTAGLYAFGALDGMGALAVSFLHQPSGDRRHD
jgi:predicted MFS family arabinose efflux permease